MDEETIRVLKAAVANSQSLIATASRAQTNPLFAEAIIRQARAIRMSRAVLSRHESSTFCEFVIRGESNGGQPITQAEFHESMHALVRDRERVVMWGSPGTGKSLQFSVGYPLWLIGRDHDIHIANIQATDGLAKKSVRATASYIADPTTPGYEELHLVFPDLKKSRRPGATWNTHGITVDRKTAGRDPTYQSCGLFGNILGARVDVALLDDVLTFVNTRNDEARKKTLNWILTTVLTRLFTSSYNVCIFMGNAWHPEDAMHMIASGKMTEALADATDIEQASAFTDELRSERPELPGFEDAVKRAAKAEKASSGWVSARYPLRDEWGKTTWPEVWPQAKLDKEYRETPPLEAARAFECVTTSEQTSRFKRAWLESSKRPGLAGKIDSKRVALMRSARPDNDGRSFYIGVDLAFADIEKRGDRTAISVIAGDSKGDVELMSIRSGRMMLDEVLEQIITADEIWQPRYIFVESNAAQIVISRILRGDLAGMGMKIPKSLRNKIVPYNTDVSKHNPKWGIEGIGVEMRLGRWHVPAGVHNELHTEIEAFYQDLLHYTPDPKVHTGDRAMSVYMAWDGMRRRLGERHFGSLATRADPQPHPSIAITQTLDEIPPPNPTETKEAFEQRVAEIKNQGIRDRAQERQQQQESTVWNELNDWLSS